MGEFKAQILAIILVLGVFVILNDKFESFFTGLWDNVENQISQKLD